MVNKKKINNKMQYPEYIETNEFNFWNYQHIIQLDYLDNNLELNNFFCTYTPPIDAENYVIFQHFMEDRIQSPTFFFHELFPLLKFSKISFIFLYNTFVEESLTLENCKAMVVIFKENDKLDCYTFTKDVLGNTNDSVIYFLGIRENDVPEENIVMHDSTEMGSFYECISKMKESVCANGLYFPSGFSEMLPEEDYVREDYLDKNDAIKKYDIEDVHIENFFIIFFNLRFPEQVNFFLIDIVFDYKKSKRIERINFISEVKKVGQLNVTPINVNPRFLVFIFSEFPKQLVFGSDNSDDVIPDGHETKILIDRKFKKIVYIDSMVKVINHISLGDLKDLLAAKLMENNIIDITAYSIEESIVSFFNDDFYESKILYSESESVHSESDIDEDYEPEDTKIYYRGNDGPRNREAPSAIYLQHMFEEISTVSYMNYCIFLSWWMLFIILKLNEYNWKSFTQIAGEDLNKLVEEKNKDFIGNILFLIIKTIKNPVYIDATKHKDKITQEQIIRENFILQNVLNRNAPASRFGSDSAKKK